MDSALLELKDALELLTEYRDSWETDFAGDSSNGLGRAYVNANLISSSFEAITAFPKSNIPKIINSSGTPNWISLIIILTTYANLSGISVPPHVTKTCIKFINNSSSFDYIIQ